MARLSKEERKQIKLERKKKRIQNKINRIALRDQIGNIKVNTYTKALVAIIILVALIDLQLSYILAFLDKVQIAESLSQQVCTTILGTALIYMIRAYMDSRAEYGTAATNKNLDAAIERKINDIVSQSGIDPEAMEHGITTVLLNETSNTDDFNDINEG